ncbi:MAG: DoxX family protein, partial [Candidatus Eremiobacteraeota bacterium]|nr:DoxX family protein [Candidatus Eremiobacteraeota bacterium]
MIADLGLLAARVVVGGGMAAHGAQKAFGWFEGPGPEGAASFMESLGFKPGATYATAASYGELTAGLLIAIGAGGPLGPAALIAVQAVAQTSVHAKNGFFAAKGGIELGTVYCAAALALASNGYGAISFDRLFGLEQGLRRPALSMLALAGAAAAAYVVLGRRDFSPPPGTLAEPTLRGDRS